MVHSNGDLWIGTQDQGIAILNALTGAIKTITTQDGLAAAYVCLAWWRTMSTMCGPPPSAEFAALRRRHALKIMI